MSEDKTSLPDVDDALEMLGKGYVRDSSLEIYPQTTVIRRRGWEMVEDVIPAFVKISTGFKAELPAIEATALKVWLYIALSINRNTEQAHPGIRTIAEGCGLAQNTITAAVKKLELLGLLTVNREDKKYNIYQIPEYISANSKSASKIEAESASKTEADDKTASVKAESASIALRLNQINQSPTTTSAPQRNIFTIYEQNFGPLTPMIADELKDAEKTYPVEWVESAMSEAVANNKRNWKYVEAILKRWQVDGPNSPKPGGTHDNAKHTPRPAGKANPGRSALPFDDAARARAERIHAKRRQEQHDAAG